VGYRGLDMELGLGRELVGKALERGFAAYLVAPAYYGFKIESKGALRFLEIAHELGVRVIWIDTQALRGWL